MKKIGSLVVLFLLMSCRFSLAQVTFNYTGAMQQYVVPPGVTGICYTVCGGQGMGNVQNSMLGGLGGRVMGVMSVVPGQILEIWVGSGGLAQMAGGFNGGARGGSVTPNAASNPQNCTISWGGGGGGASDIRVAPYGLANRVAVGGGGGGTGGNRSLNCSPGCGGGGGGGYYGGGGGGAYGGSPGQGGTQAAGGLGGASCCGCPLSPQPGAAGALGTGGNGGGLTGGNMQFANNPGCAGGHAGGLVGLAGPNCTGGTGCPSTWAGASGAGGSSYGAPATTPTITAQFQTGHGIVILNPNCCAAPTLTAGATPTSICLGQLTTLTVTGAGAGGTYTWLPSNTTGSSIVVSPTATTIYTVQGATSTSTCQGTKTVQVVLNPAPVVVVNNPTTCVGGNILLTANGGTAYTWTGPNVYSSAIQNPTISNALPTMSGNYTVLVTSAQGCTNTGVAGVTVAPAPNVTALGTNTVCSQNLNGSTNTVALSANGANTYTWSLPIGYNAFPNTTSQTFTMTPPFVPALSVASISVTGSGALGCTATAVYNVTVYPNPVMNLSPLTPSICYGTSSTLTATGANNYVWFPGNTLNTTTGSVVVASPTTTTIYNIVGENLGCFSATQNTTLQVVPNPTVLILSATATVCLGNGLTLNGNGATSYSWAPGNSLNSTFGPMVIATPTSNTTYTLIGTLNTCTAMATKQVTTITLPTLQAAATRTNICQGEVVTINANGANSYSWSASSGAINTPNSNFISVSPAVTTTYNLVGSNGMCAGLVKVAISVVPMPILNLTTSNNKICQGKSTTIFASGSQSYTWSPMTGVTLLNANTASVNPAVNTNYTVTAINTDGIIKCGVTKELLIEVVPQVTASVSNSVALCAGESAKLIANGGNYYFWTPSEGLNVTNESIVYANPKTTTLYTVNVSNAGNCGVNTTVLVKINPTPTVDAGPDLTFNSDEPMYISAKGTGTLTWIAGEGIHCVPCPNTQIFPTSTGCYKVQAVNQYGCKAVDEVCVEVTTNYNIYIPDVFSPNGDGKNDVFTVYGTGLSKLEIMIFDRWGEKLCGTTDPQKGWDGMYKGVLCKPDVYVYEVRFTGLDGKAHTKTGHVTLMK